MGAAPCGQEGILVNEQVTMTLSAGWRFLTPEEHAQLGSLADDPSVRLVAVAQTTDEGHVPTFVVTGGELTTDASDDDVYADTVRQVEDALPGFHLIDDFTWPVTPQGARWRTGVYILDNVSLTLTQLTWTACISARLMTAKSPTSQPSPPCCTPDLPSTTGLLTFPRISSLRFVPWMRKALKMCSTIS